MKLSNLTNIETKYSTLFPVILAAVLLVILIISPTGFEGALTYQNADRVRARVLSTDESKIIDTGLIRTGEQRCRILILDGHFEGEEADAVNYLNGSLEQDKLFEVGDTAFVAVSYSGDEITAVTMTDHYRLGMEALLAGLFLLLLILFAGKTGLRAILSLYVYLLMWKVLVPCLLRGMNPVWVALGLVTLLTFLILSLIYGWDKRCLAASGGAILGILVTAVLGKYFHKPIQDTRRGHGVERKSALRRLSISRPDPRYSSRRYSWVRQARSWICRSTSVRRYMRSSKRSPRYRRARR